MKNINQHSEDHMIRFAHRKGAVHLHIDHIVRLQSDSNYTIIHTDIGRPFIMSKGLKQYEKLLKPFDFIRTSRSHLVNKTHIVDIGKEGHVILDDESIAITSRRRKVMVKALLASVVLCFFSLQSFAQAISISESATTPDISAILDISSTSKGLLIPRLSTIQRMEINFPAEGLLVFDTNYHKYCTFTQGAWRIIQSGPATLIEDSDSDTKIQTEKNQDEDIVRIDIAGTEQWRFKRHTLENLNGGQSLFIGEGAGLNDDLTNNWNTGIGIQSLGANTSGGQNCATGINSLSSNTTGWANSSFGAWSLEDNTVGNHNAALGYISLYHNVNGSKNTAVGAEALWGNVSGSRNTAIGYSALQLGTANHGNVAIGERALFSNQASNNTAVGTYSMESN